MPLNEFWRSSKKVQLSYGNLVKLRPETEEDLEAVGICFPLFPLRPFNFSLYLSLVNELRAGLII
jgi:hypothetical protein